MSHLKMTVLEQAAEDNKVFTRWVHEGTHTGEPLMRNRPRR